jgi:hypothetical protein
MTVDDGVCRYFRKAPAHALAKLGTFLPGWDVQNGFLTFGEHNFSLKQLCVELRATFLIAHGKSQGDSCGNG